MKIRFLASILLVSLLFSTFVFNTSWGVEDVETSEETSEESSEKISEEKETSEETSEEEKEEEETLNEATCEATSISLKMDKNTILTSNLIGTSTNEEATLTYIIVEEPSHGSLVHEDESSSDFTYTPELDYIGTDSFTYKVNDGTNDSNIATVTITIEAPSEDIIPFNYIDMQEHWANYSASHLAARGLIIGEEIGNRFYFYPDRQMTRGDFILFLLAITESNEDATITMPNVSFADADDTADWLVEAAKLAYAKGIIKGSAEGNSIYLNAYHPLTRKEAVVMLNNTLKLEEVSKDVTYKDLSSIPDWALPAVKNLTAYSIVQGNDLNEFNPDKIITRAEAAELSFKLIKQLETQELSDIK